MGVFVHVLFHCSGIRHHTITDADAFGHRIILLRARASVPKPDLHIVLCAPELVTLAFESVASRLRGCDVLYGVCIKRRRRRRRRRAPAAAPAAAARRLV